ncbi:MULTISPECIES: heavy metal translocating P-type ATPase [unclassified Cryobacterium]|uniref:heavy metal translocating P-type ATPase n=1 Tax=unclassified Cryobacterium TaxID=2649013 RepID=UPI002AB3E66D|nr:MULTISPECIES: heavy metal translocating P-type ATPase [unclassified Cryobacterium]MDY7528997.1 heavy metal translocating P-type ATPase [Cryobacterium sp. 10C2]MDY7558836.1 heavy metal translocating P-type ATPase [Cryobacterium sp. 10C3]MEB0202010.1 heavy metal translocating P-type ATPase [Cryobacterium sp. 5I3]MEB0285642.1 heavy metal translocating P-type ATPase [Cryobacterium sp. 10S3]MEB0289951.1 heavy metal translocating P-type ATPase [Cryobacterium sp. 10C2]
MSRLFAAVRRYPLVAATIVLGVVGIGLALAGFADSLAWLFGGFGLFVAAISAVGMVKQLRHGSFGVDLLAITAIVATVLVGEYVATILIVLMLTGGAALEDFAVNRAKRELNALLNRAPQIAHRLRSADDLADVEDLPATAVQPGDLLLVRPAEIVPVDGVLESASAAFDESSLTGESLPVERNKGEGILSGSINGQAAATIRATATAANSQYQQIVALVEEASASKAPVVRLADRYAVPFTAVALSLAALAWILTGEPVRFAEVLVVATPCPLLISAPIAFMGGMSRAARNGIIVKGGGVLEALSRARTIVFDKTGTLTHGTPAIARVLPAAGFDADEVLALAASAEQYSSHVLAASVIAEARSRGLELLATATASEVPAHGVVARLDGREVTVGKLSFVAETAPAAVAAPLDGGELAIYVAVDGSFAGSIVASDQLRGNARQTIDALGELGIRNTVMLTGDARPTAEHIAALVGITNVQADCLPVDKVEGVRAITERPVIMVGDGVNDAPVLAVADVGIAMGARGATAASESADVVILIDDLSRTARAVAIGQDTIRIALQSIWIGIALSLVLMVFAAFGLIPATIGALLQELVDLATILNALRAIGGRRDAALAAGSVPVHRESATALAR